MSSSHGFACVTRVYICSALRWALVLHPEIVSLCAHWWGYVSMSWEQSFHVTLYPTLYTRNDEGESQILGGKIALYSTLSRDRAKVIRWEIFFCLSLMMLDEQTAACCVLVWHHITVWSKVGKREWFDLTLCIVGARLREKKALLFRWTYYIRARAQQSRAHKSREHFRCDFQILQISLLPSFVSPSLQCFFLSKAAPQRAQYHNNHSSSWFVSFPCRRRSSPCSLCICKWYFARDFHVVENLLAQWRRRRWTFILFTVCDEEKPSPPPLLLCFVAVFIPEFTSHSNFYLAFQNSRKLSSK